jgi:hypothetical protein
MNDSKTWMVDQIAAANIGRALGLELDEQQLATVGEHLAEHRASALDMAASRIRETILERVYQARLAVHERRSAEWSEGCRSAEHAIMAMSSTDLLALPAAETVSQGQVLRTLIRHARKRSDAGRPVARRG